jgi:hypothetical protein
VVQGVKQRKQGSLVCCLLTTRSLTLFLWCRVDERSTLSPSAKQIYLINCLAAIAAALGGRACCAGRAAALAHAAEGHMARLVGGEAGALLARCGLAEIADRVRCARSLSSLLCPRSGPCCTSFASSMGTTAHLHQSLSFARPVWAYSGALCNVAEGVLAPVAVHFFMQLPEACLNHS